MTASNLPVPDPSAGPLDQRHRAARPSQLLVREPNQEGTSPASGPTFLADLRLVVVMFLVWRGLLFGLDYAGRSLSFPIDLTAHYPASFFWDGYVRMDSLHFASIVRDGYKVETFGPYQGRSTNAAFFPLYPYMVKAFCEVAIPGYRGKYQSIWAPGLVISNVSFILALVYILRIARQSLDEETSRRSLVYLLVFPTSFFFSAYYSEGLFLLTTSASIYHFLKGHHARSGLWGFLAVLTRSPGVVLLPALVGGHLWQRRFRIDRSDVRLLWLGLIPCGLAAVMALFYWKLGDPLAFSKAHEAWGRSFMLPTRTLWKALRQLNWAFPIRDRANTVLTIDLLSSLAFLALPLFLLRGYHKALPLHAMLLIVMPLSTGSLMSMTRCEAVAFPAFFALAQFGRNREVDRLIVFGSGLFLALFKLAFANGYFFG